MFLETYDLADDGRTPNHPRYPLLLYRGAFVRGGKVESAEKAIAHFAKNGWSGAWVNGIYPFQHYHATAHEVLANLGAPVDVQFGGAGGPILTVDPGDAVVIPAGGGHCRISDGEGLIVVGAYPERQENWDLKRADNPADYQQALLEIPRVASPENDPVSGRGGPLHQFWSA